MDKACTTIDKNGLLSGFITTDSDAAAFANMTVADQIKKLSSGLDDITSNLHSQVRKEYGALLSHATHAGNLDTTLNCVASDVERIQTAVNKLKTQIVTQYETIESQTKVLGRLHNASHILRSCDNLLLLANKLKNTKDVLTQASLHFELDPLVEDGNLRKIEMVIEERRFVVSHRQQLKNFAQTQLVNGLKERNSSNVINSLKIFQNFHLIEESLNNLIKTFVSEIQQSIAECFAGNDISALNAPSSNTERESKSSPNVRGPGKTPVLTTTQSYRAKFWKSLHWLIYDELYEYCDQILLLKTCLQEINLINLASSRETAVHFRFWSQVQSLLKNSFSECAVHIKQTLEEGLAKLISSVRSFEAKLGGRFVFDPEVFEPLEVGYLSKCGANLKACLAGIDLPSHQNIDELIRLYSAELSASMVDNRLQSAVGAIVISCNKDFFSKIESQIKLGTDSTQVVDIPNISQIQNTNLANLLFYQSDSSKRMIWNLGKTFSESQTAESIMENLKYSQQLLETILQQIIDSIISTVKIILLSVHREPGLNSDKISISGPSMYMKEFREFVIRAWTNHIQAFDDKETIKKCGEELVTRCVDLFVHNIILLKPISDAGRNRLKNDCIFMENTLKQIIPNLSELGKPFRLLRSMSTLIVQSPQDIIKHDITNESPVSSYIILFLLFGHSGADLQSPHEAAHWSIERLINWLDGHTSDMAKLELISGSLQRYKENARRNNTSHYDPIYPMLTTYFEKVLKNLE